MGTSTGSFEVVVKYRNGKTKVKNAVIGGGSMTASQLSDHYVRFNHFPGAESVTIREMEGRLPPTMSDTIKSRTSLSKQLKPLVTPKAQIVSEKYVPAELEDASKAPKAPGTFAQVAEERSVPRDVDEEQFRAVQEQQDSSKPQGGSPGGPAK